MDSTNLGAPTTLLILTLAAVTVLVIAAYIYLNCRAFIMKLCRAAGVKCKLTTFLLR